MKPNANIKVVGVGGSGSNAISRMTRCKIKGVELIAINTDIQDLRKTKADLKLRIGKKTTQGLGTGMSPEIGRRSALENKSEISEILKDSDMVFVAGGFGGGTCTGAAPIVAEAAREKGALTIAIITKPFSFEGQARKKIAESGIRKLQEKTDCLISISNDKLLHQLPANVTLLNAFWICDDVLRQAVQGISDLIMLPGIINVDFADVKAIMKNSGTALFGIGRARGEKRAEVAAKLAINSPLLDTWVEGGLHLKGAKGLLFNISGGKDISLSEIDEVAKVVTQEVNPEAKVIFGAVQDEKLKKGELKVTVIATGF
jgi:cell division protein FtsZ